MSSRMRVTKGHSGNRRAHHSLKDIRLSDCSNCKSKHERHKVCLECGFYKGNKVLDVSKKNKDLATTIEPKKTKITSKKDETKTDKK